MAPLGLSLYNLAARRRVAQPTERPERPPGRLIWLHAPEEEHIRSLGVLAEKIRDEDGHPVLVTTPGSTAPAALAGGTLWQPSPGETVAEVTAMLDHWQPDAILFSGGELRPALIDAAAGRKIPMALVEARIPHLPDGRDGWYPGLIRATLAHLQEILALDDAAARALRKAGVNARMAVTGRMEQPCAVLPGNEAEREELARLMNSRPVWLAAALPQAEEAAVIEAHRAGLRLAHRLLLILVPEDPARATELAASLERAEGWMVASRSADEEPEPETEVFIADAAEMGLWYRLAPITFLGGSLAGTGCIRDPMEAAALGSSLIHGPRPGPHGAILGRLGAARATRSVASGGDLAEALAELLSPDRAAKLAQSAWTVASDGVEVTERVHSLLRRMLGED